MKVKKYVLPLVMSEEIMDKAVLIQRESMKSLLRLFLSILVLCVNAFYKNSLTMNWDFYNKLLQQQAFLLMGIFPFTTPNQLLNVTTTVLALSESDILFPTL